MGSMATEISGNGVVIVNPKPSKGFTSKAVDWIEKVVVKLMYDSSQPHHWLFGNFAPVDETPPCKDLDVIGHLPVCYLPFLLVFTVMFLLYFNFIIGQNYTDGPSNLGTKRVQRFPK